MFGKTINVTKHILVKKISIVIYPVLSFAIFTTVCKPHPWPIKKYRSAEEISFCLSACPSQNRYHFTLLHYDNNLVTIMNHNYLSSFSATL